MKRRLFSIFLALALCLSLLPAAAFAEDEPALGFYTAAECGASSYVEPGSTVGYYTLPTIGTLWLRSDGSFNTSQLNNDLVASYSQSDDGRTVEIKLNEDKFKGNNSYSLNVSSDGVSVSIYINSGISSSSSISVSDKKGEEYEVGFADLSGDAQTIIYGTWVYRGVTGEPKPENTREFFYSPIVSAAKVVEDENGQHYEFGDGLPVSVEVISMEIRPAYSEDTNEDFGETFSFSADPEAVLATSSVSGNQVSLYRKQGYTGTFVLLAAVEVTVDGAKQSGVVSLPLMAYRIEEATVECGEDDDAADISAAIDDVVDNLKDHKGTVYVKLKGTRYEGELVLPADMMETKGDYEIRFEADNESGRTAIVGGVNLNNSAASFYDIDFIAPDKAAADGTEARALYGGQAWTDGCTFSGYDVAMDAVGSVTCGMKPNNSVFADNGIAVRVDLDNDTGVSLGGDWTGNAFINNDTAVQILSLSPGMSPYYFRIIDNNFVNNDTDFDIQYPGTFYFYRNYYGRVKKNVDDMTSA